MIPLQTASSHPVTHILFSPDGSAVVAAQPNYGLTLLDRATGRTLAVCAMPRRAAFTGLTFCGGGKFLAAAHAKGVEIFDANTGTRVACNFRWSIKELKLADRGDRLLGINRFGTHRVWVPDVPGGCGFDDGTVRIGSAWPSAAVSPDGRFACRLASGVRSATAVLFDLEADRSVARIDYPTPHESTAAGIAKFCPLGRRFAINRGRTIDVYDVRGLAEEDEGDQVADTPLVQRANGSRVALAPKPHTKLTAVFVLKPDKPGDEGRWYPPFELAADGRGLLVKRPRNRIQLWDAPTGTLMSEWSWRLEWVTCVAVSVDGLTAAAGGRFGRILLWDLE